MASAFAPVAARLLTIATAGAGVAEMVEHECLMVGLAQPGDDVEGLGVARDSLTIVAGVSGLTASTPFGFAGGYTDPTGLVYLVDRYYDPQTGQFMSVDPQLSQTLQPYAYASDNPVSDGDPTGQVTWFTNHETLGFNIHQVTVTSETCGEVGASFIINGQVQYCHSDTTVENRAEGHIEVSATWAYTDGWTSLAYLKGDWWDKEGNFVNPFQLFFVAPEGKGRKPHYIRHRWYKNAQTGNHVAKGHTGWFEAAGGAPHHGGVLLLG